MTPEQVPSSDTSLTELSLQMDKVKLERERLEFERERDRLPFFQRNWQAVISVAISVAAACISGGQFFSSLAVAKQDQDIKRVEAIQKFLPDIMSSDRRYVALTLLTGSNLMTQAEVASIAFSLKETKVLGDLNNAGYKPAGVYERTLKNKMTELINDMFSNDANRRRTSTAALLSDWNNDPNLVPALLEHAATNPTNENGVYNTVILLESLRPEVLTPYRDGILSFVESAKQIGPKTTGATALLLQKLNTATSLK